MYILLFNTKTKILSVDTTFNLLQPYFIWIEINLYLENLFRGQKYSMFHKGFGGGGGGGEERYHTACKICMPPPKHLCPLLEVDKCSHPIKTIDEQDKS